MISYLLDLNALISLAWPTHVHHEYAHRWLAQQERCNLATCPITQCGFVRISSNPKIIPDAVPVGEALHVLQAIINLERHLFWEDDLNLNSQDLLPQELLIGHNQVTDAYLVALARKHGGKLVTIDRRLKEAVRSGDFNETVILIQT